jgi:hypothetical protein
VQSAPTADRRRRQATRERNRTDPDRLPPGWAAAWPGGCACLKTTERLATGGEFAPAPVKGWRTDARSGGSTRWGGFSGPATRQRAQWSVSASRPSSGQRATPLARCPGDVRTGGRRLIGAACGSPCCFTWNVREFLHASRWLAPDAGPAEQERAVRPRTTRGPLGSREGSAMRTGRPGCGGRPTADDAQRGGPHSRNPRGAGGARDRASRRSTWPAHTESRDLPY